MLAYTSAALHCHPVAFGTSCVGTIITHGRISTSLQRVPFRNAVARRDRPLSQADHAEMMPLSHWFDGRQFVLGEPRRRPAGTPTARTPLISTALFFRIGTLFVFR